MNWFVAKKYRTVLFLSAFSLVYLGSTMANAQQGAAASNTVRFNANLESKDPALGFRRPSAIARTRNGQNSANKDASIRASRGRSAQLDAVPMLPMPVDAEPDLSVGRVVAPSVSRRWAAISGEEATVRVDGDPNLPNPLPIGHPMTSVPDPNDAAIPLRPRAKSLRLPLFMARVQSGGNKSLVYASSGPDVTVEANGPRRVLVGEPTTYTVSVNNAGAIDAKGVFVRIAIPDTVEVSSANETGGIVQHHDDGGAKRELIWNFEVLPAKSREALELSIVPATGGPIEMEVEWTMLPKTDTLTIETLEPQLELAVEGPEKVVYGDVPRYKIKVSNPGSGPAKDVVVDLATYGNSNQRVPVGVVEAGRSTEFQIELNKLEPGVTRIEAKAEASHGLSAESFHEVFVGKALLEMSAVGPTARLVGAPAAYHVEVRNVGNGTASEVEASALLPSGIDWIDIPQGAYEKGDGIAWQMGDIQPGETRQFIIRGKLIEHGNFELAFAAADKRKNLAVSKVITVVEPVADVQMSVVASAPKVPVGDEVVYEIQLENRGTRSADDLQTVVRFAPGVIPIGVDGAQADMSNGDVRFQTIDKLEPEQRITLLVRARADRPGSLSYRVAVHGSGDTTRLAHEGATSFFHAVKPRPQVRLSVDSDVDRLPVGENHVYRIRLRNESDIAAENLEVRIELTPEVEPISIDHVVVQKNVNHAVVHHIEKLAPGQQRLLDLVVRSSASGVHPYRIAVASADRLTRLAHEGVTFFYDVVAPRPQLRLAVETALAKVPTGQNCEYKIRLRNVSDVRAEELQLNVEFSQGVEVVTVDGANVYADDGGVVSHQLNDVAPGQHKLVEVVARANAPGVHHYRVLVTSSDGATRIAQEGVTTFYNAPDVKPSVRLSVDQSAGKVPMGKDFIYRVRLRNDSQVLAENMILNLQFANDVEPVSINGANMKNSTDGKVHYSIKKIQPGREMVLEVAARAMTTGDHPYRFELVDADGRTQHAYESSTVAFEETEPLPNISMRIESSRSKAPVGEEVDYVIYLRNNDLDPTEPVQLAMHFGRGLEPLRVDGAEASMAYDRTIVFQPIDQLIPSIPRAIKVTARAQMPGSVSYRAELATSAGTRQAAVGTTSVFLAKKTSSGLLVR